MNTCCESCSNPASLICFCNKSLFCCSCIGQHLLSPVSSLHRPVVLNADLAQLITLSLSKLIQSEKDVLEKAAQQHKTRKFVSARLSSEIESITSFYSSTSEAIHKKITELKSLLDSTESSILQSLQETCEEAKSQLQLWKQSLETQTQIPNSIPEPLTNCTNFSQMQEIQIVLKSFEVSLPDFEEFVKKGFSFNLQFQDCTTGMFQDSPEAATMHSQNLAEDSDEDSNYARLRFSVNIENPKISNRYSSTIAYRSPRTKYRNTTYAKYGANLNQRTQISEVPARLVWIDPISECLLIYSIQTRSTNNLFLPNKSQELEGSVWCFVADGSIVLTGGVNPQCRKQTLIIDGSTGVTFAAAGMSCGRYNHAMVCVGGFLYAIGGSNGSALRECEKYSVAGNSWQKVGNLNVAREYLAACVHRGRIYVAGGEGADSIEAYNTVSNKFSLLRVRLHVCSKSLMASIEDQMIIFHGNKIISFDSAKMSYVEVSELAEENWYSPFTPVVQGKELFFIKKGTVYAMDITKGELRTLETLT